MLFILGQVTKGAVKTSNERKIMLKFFKKSARFLSRGVSRGSLALALLMGMFFCSADASAATDIVTYTSEGGITWDFSSVLEMMFTAIGAAIAAGVIIWVAIKGYQLMKRFLSGR